ncbi:hypothetical protein BX600DRAFT_507733 [Xylariales sp. PMI_506]|nr:hypothetical protein BX600DRAFT_507733 [Xylariales sp. PMI_506]
MALTIKNLNTDASFLLSFEPVYWDSFQGSVVVPQPFTILLDPWITGPSTIFHPKISISTQKQPACIASLSELPEPDLVIISQPKSDHCNEATLRQLPPTGTKTLILADPATARSIRSWKYFDHDKVQQIEKWQDPRAAGKSTVLRIPVPSVTPGGEAGEVTLSWIPQKWDISGVHSAIGITYRPPAVHGLRSVALPSVLTPPDTPMSSSIPIPTQQRAEMLFPPSPPLSPLSSRSAGSFTKLLPSPTRLTVPTSADVMRPISVVFAPHGVSCASLLPYATSHLVAEAALPLTALLHCMDSVANPWWFGGNICAGMLVGAEIARRLGARVWASAHDGDKDVRGLATGFLKVRRWGMDEIQCSIESDLGNVDGKKGPTTAIYRLAGGEAIQVLAEGTVLSDGKAKNDTMIIEEAMRV